MRVSVRLRVAEEVKEGETVAQGRGVGERERDGVPVKGGVREVLPEVVLRKSVLVTQALGVREGVRQGEGEGVSVGVREGLPDAL